MTHNLQRVGYLEFSPLKRGKVSVGAMAYVSADMDVWGGERSPKFKAYFFQNGFTKVHSGQKMPGLQTIFQPFCSRHLRISSK